MKRSNEVAVTKNKKQLQHFEADKQVFKPLKRTSDLLAPIMLLEGHKSKILTVQFSFCGKQIATGSHDKKILLWNAYEDCRNFGELNTTQPVLDLGWSRDNSHLYSCSSDSLISYWDLVTGERIKKYRGHKSIVNSISVSKRGNEMVASVSDDGTLKVWDRNGIVKDFKTEFPLVSVAFSQDASLVYCSGVDSTIHAYDLRKDAVLYSLAGHEDIVTGLKVSPKGDLLLSNSMDNTGILNSLVRVWDIRPFSVNETRLETILEGAPHGYEKNIIRPCWSPDQDYIACGSGDRTVVVWERESKRVVYKLPGHKGCVNQVDWSQSLLLSGANDGNAYIGELDIQ